MYINILLERQVECFICFSRSSHLPVAFLGFSLICLIGSADKLQRFVTTPVELGHSAILFFFANKCHKSIYLNLLKTTVAQQQWNGIQ